MELKDALKIGITHIFDKYMVKYVEFIEGAMVRKTHLSDDSKLCHGTACIIEEEGPFLRA